MNPWVLGLLFRAFQLLMNVIIMGLAIGIDSKFNNPHSTYVFALTMMTFIWIIPLLFNNIIRWYPVHVVFLCETLMAILWLVGMAIALSDYARQDCVKYRQMKDGSVYSERDQSCYVGKAMCGFAVIQWVSFLVTLTLIIAFIIHPISSSIGFSKVFTQVKYNRFYPGGVFCGEVYVNTPSREDEELVEYYSD